MDKNNNKPFEVYLLKEKEYFRLYVTHTSFKGRIRKRLGDKSYEELENISFNLKYELNKHFLHKEINRDVVESFIDDFVSMNVKCNASIFDYKADFLSFKRDTTNKKTKKKLSRSTISGYMTALKYFESYMVKEKISSHPSQITEK